MSRRQAVVWALGVLRDNGYWGSVEHGPDGEVRSVTWATSDASAEDEQHQGDDRQDDEDGPEHTGAVPPDGGTEP